MEVLIGQTQQNMLMCLSMRACYFSGLHVPLRKLHTSRIARFHSTVLSQNQIGHKNGPLTLSSLGFGNKGKVVKIGKRRKLGNATAASKLPSSRAGTARLQKQIDNDNDHLVLKNPGVREAKMLKNDKISMVGDMNSAKEGPSTRAKQLSERFAAERTKKVPAIDATIFAAKSFSELDLSPLLIKRLEEENLTVPTEVQSRAIPTISMNHDVVIQSYTGSGKTFAYLLPILSEVGPLKKPVEGEESDCKVGIEAVIVAPSRELGMQIVREAEKLLGPAGKKSVQQLVGGANRLRQEEALKKNKPAIVVGTPGRIAEISASGKLHTHGCRFLVLDEVDQLLAFNFREDMRRILEHMGRRSGAQTSKASGLLAKRAERQLIMVSATVPSSVLRAASSWGTDPLLVKAKSVAPLESLSIPRITTISTSDSTAASTSSVVTQAAVDSLPPALQHYYCVTKAQHKVDTLRRCVHALEAKSVIAFLNHSKQLKDVVFKLEARGMRSAALHGDLGKLGRSTTLKNFKNGELRVLVTNELSARGLDVFECDLVVNLDLPTDSVHYAHRAGRTGRLGQKGNVVTICEEPEVFVVKKLRRQLGVAIQACQFTEGKLVICKEGEEKDKITEAVGVILPSSNFKF